MRRLILWHSNRVCVGSWPWSPLAYIGRKLRTLRGFDTRHLHMKLVALDGALFKSPSWIHRHWHPGKHRFKMRIPSGTDSERAEQGSW